MPRTPEEIAANKAYFESKGLDIDFSQEEKAKLPVAEPPVKPKEEPVAAPAKPADGSAAIPPADELVVDDETRAEFEANQSANEGDKPKRHLGSYAKKNLKLREQAVALSEKDRKIAELEGRLAERPAAPAPASTFTAPETKTEVAPPPPAPEPEIKAKEFDKPKPARPKLDDYADKDDPMGDLAQALAQYADDVSDWKDEKRTHDEQQRVEVATKKQEFEAKRASETTLQSVRAEKYREVTQKYSDFDQRTKAAAYSNVLLYVLRDRLATKDGLELGYQLALPENAELLNSINEKTKNAMTQDDIKDAVDETITELAILRHGLKNKAPKDPAPPAPAAAAPAAPVAAPQTPPAAPPRREEPTPTPVRARGTAPALDPDEVDPMDSDARRALRQKTGKWN